VNRTEIEAKWNTLTPRERDAWVAEVVTKYIPLNTAPNSDGTFGFLPNYTTDISSAWAVLESSRAWGGMEIQFHAHGYTVETSITNDDDTEAQIVTKPTAPEAICLASLIVKITEKEATV